jgi:hypothetical protein
MAISKTPLDSANKAGFDAFYAGKLGAQLNRKRCAVKGIWDFADQGGAVGTGFLKDEDGNEIQLPAGAIITQVFTYEETNVTTSASGTLALTAASSGDLMAAKAAASWSGIQDGVPVNTAATMIRLSSAAKLQYEIATGALTAGKVQVYVEFVYIA